MFKSVLNHTGTFFYILLFFENNCMFVTEIGPVASLEKVASHRPPITHYYYINYT